MHGDKGPLKFTRKAAVLGVPPPAAKPLAKEYALLEKLTPAKIVSKAKKFLDQYGVKKESELGNDPTVLLLGEPHEVERGGKKLCISKVLNQTVKGWGPVKAKPPIGDNGIFDDTSVKHGFYHGDPLTGQWFVESLDEGLEFYDNITAAVIDKGIKFNTHSAGFGQSVPHEILHTFEGSKLAPSQIMKEGIVEKYAILLCAASGVALETYPAYEQYMADVNNLIRFTSIEIIAKAYFGDDEAAIAQLIPIFYDPINKTLPAKERLSAQLIQEAGKLDKVKNDYLSQAKMKAKDSWYRKWVAAHGGNPPAGGLALPPLPGGPGGGLPLPPPPKAK